MRMEAPPPRSLSRRRQTLSFDGSRRSTTCPSPIAPGEMRAIIGPNGAGKTTMMDVVTGRPAGTAAIVMFNGVYNLTKLDETENRQSRHRPQIQKPTVFDSHHRVSTI